MLTPVCAVGVPLSTNTKYVPADFNVVVAMNDAVMGAMVNVITESDAVGVLLVEKMIISEVANAFAVFKVKNKISYSTSSSNSW